MPDKPNKAFISKMSALCKESKLRLFNTIDSILDKYKGTSKQKNNLEILSKILLMEDELVSLIEKYKTVNEKEREKILIIIEDIINNKQKMYKKILKNN